MLTPYEELYAKLPRVFRNEDLLCLTEEEMNNLLELSFLDTVNFTYSGGQYLLWIDWMNEDQFKQVVITLLRGIY